MNPQELLAASSRVALAGLVHDIGKFAERAGIDPGAELLESNLHQYARRQEGGGRQWFTHRHAAYTAVAVDLLERHFPRLKGDDVAPFAAWDTPDVDDSLINAAARHHKPETALQWIIATADRVASGFERETFDRYNDAQEGTETGGDHFSARQLTLFEQIRLDGSSSHKASLHYRYALQPLSPKAIFPQTAQDCEPPKRERDNAKKQYRTLWDQFTKALEAIPASHQDRLDLWLDHFDTLLATFAHSIPAATAFGVKPEVSLYDHSKAVAALATALWRWHQARDDDPASIVAAHHQRSDWDGAKLLLIQGDLFGIQDFIFAAGGETQRRAAKLLRGRSFYVGLLTECAAMRVLDALALPPTSQIINAAGKFLIVAPNTEQTRSALTEVRRSLDAWFLEHSFGQAGVGLAWLGASCNDFLSAPGDQANSHQRFQTLMKRLFAQLDNAKAQRFDLCGGDPPPAVFEGFLDRFDNRLGACQIDGRSPAELAEHHEGGTIALSRLAKDQIDIGNWLTRFERLLVTREAIGQHTLDVDLFGYRIAFTGDETDSGRFGPAVRDGNLLRAWDFSVPADDGWCALWNGYARRYINGYIPRFSGESLSDYERDKYAACDPDADGDFSAHEPKTLNHLACEDQRLDEKERWVGIRALSTLKGDIDNLGLIFQQGLAEPTFAKMAALSRQTNAFFAVYLPWLCQHEYRNTYTVFAGGDDFFLIGPWRSQITLARRLRAEFERYVAGNPEIHFSAGLSTTKPGLPIRHLAELGEQALEDAKSMRPEKNAVTCFGETVSWEAFEALAKAEEELESLSEELGLSTGYVYGLIELIEKAETVNERPEHAIWHSQFAYRTARMLERLPGLRDRSKADERRRLQQRLAQVIAQGGIERFGGKYRIPLFTHLYQTRD
ncbi:MAG: type III-A CRISPR-associated protein Cas10/Csm1 [Gammaproteobacteria bacterium]|jgi:CRISPR-associated protein Csm1|nr:type III-A CRISPR-associated protein Cas10/Csm1 [Gammaproteobacteria bacterium]